MIGRSLDRYRLVSLLGEGGMGAVYAAEDTTLGREVAVKVLRPELAANPDLVQRFLTEATTLAKLGHPNIATLFELKQDSSVVYMVMELVRGHNLETVRQQRGALPWPETAEVARQTLSALHYAHGRGVVHRDIKPSNLMFDEHGGIKVMDFGIARVLGTAKATRTGHVVGTAEYMAPEQITGREVDGRTDLYALGIVLYELLTGHGPFDATSDYGLMKAHVEMPVEAPGLQLPGLPAWFDDIIVRLLAKSPDDRFIDAAECRAAIERGLGLPSVGHVSPAPGGPVAKPTRLATPAPPPTREARPAPGPGLDEPTPNVGRGNAPVHDGRAPVRAAFPWSWQLGAAAAAIAVMLAAPVVWWFGRASEPEARNEPRASEPTRPSAAGSGAPSPQAVGGGIARQEPDVPRILETPPSAPPTPPQGGALRPGRVPVPAPDAPTAPPAASEPPGMSPRAPATTSGVQLGQIPRENSALKPMSFDRVRLLDTVDGKSREVEVRVILTVDRIDVVDKKTSERLRQVRYDRIDRAAYSFSKHPRWKAGAAAAVASGVLAAPLFFMKSTRHWLTVQAGTDVLILRLDKSNFQTVVPTLESRGGLKVEMVEPEKSD